MSERITCAAGMDGDCYATDCVQLRDGEPVSTGRSCPLPTGNPWMALREMDEQAQLDIFSEDELFDVPDDDVIPPEVTP